MFRMVAPTFVSEEREVDEFHEEHLANDDDVDLTPRASPQFPRPSSERPESSSDDSDVGLESGIRMDDAPLVPPLPPSAPFLHRVKNELHF